MWLGNKVSNQSGGMCQKRNGLVSLQGYSASTPYETCNTNRQESFSSRQTKTEKIKKYTHKLNLPKCNNSRGTTTTVQL
eukprot:m.267256 g.267256  ORF g.267256 m.267256 type:complete len:79 (+) comp15634_c9_seq1:146-382(+)